MLEDFSMSHGKSQVALTATDIPEATLSEPLESHSIPALRWWLLCRGWKCLQQTRDWALSWLSSSPNVSSQLALLAGSLERR